jgi:low temperature requirement protein LtrA
MLSRLIRPPRVRTAGAEGEIQRATWMELFYDLVFVVTQLGNRLSTDHTFVALFIPVWWAWVGHTIYASELFFIRP